MTVRHLNPVNLARPDGFVHVAIGTGTRLISVAGQVGIDERGRLAGADDLAAQTEQALLNVHTALTAAGATFTTSSRSRSTSWTGMKASCHNSPTRPVA